MKNDYLLGVLNGYEWMQTFLRQIAVLNRNWPFASESSQSSSSRTFDGFHGRGKTQQVSHRTFTAGKIYRGLLPFLSSSQFIVPPNINLGRFYLVARRRFSGASHFPFKVISTLIGPVVIVTIVTHSFPAMTGKPRRCVQILAEDVRRSDFRPTAQKGQLARREMNLKKTLFPTPTKQNWCVR